MLRLMYTILLGLFLAIFVGTGIAVVYREPSPPAEPSWMRFGFEKNNLTTSQRQSLDRYTQSQQNYQTKVAAYNRIVSLISLGAAIIMVAIALLLTKQLEFLAGGFMLGGIFTVLYAVIKGFESGNSSYRFIVATAGLATIIGIGYNRFASKAGSSAAADSSYASSVSNKSV